MRAQGTALTIARDAFLFELQVDASRRARVRLSNFTDSQIDASPETPCATRPRGRSRRRYGGIYEDYDALTGQAGYAPGLQLPTAFSYGHSASAIVEAIRRRYTSR
ncbi:MAG: hypothetical protein ACXVSF_15890 [Solirubrobacteraceae bacterium]